MVLLALYPWVEIKSDSSPFVMIFHNLDSNLVASALNFVILVASLSVYNSGVYSNSRMLFGLSVQGNAPKFLARVSKRGVPVNSLLLSGIITSLVVVLNYLLPHEALGLLMALVVATLLLNWIMICMAHLKFRAAQRRKGRESKFKALLAPASNYFCIAFLGLILAADVHYRRHASVGDPAAGVDPVPVYRLQTACAARRKRDAPPSGGAACLFIVILFAGGAFAWRSSFCNRLLLF
ncbi:phenylalanine transporter [Klebsiella pneumoniae]|uniref:Phenylalanine transporter n=1 Tax=Klebsiella pneumoniae TaxID=573 RepID=A0A378F8N8_KLEPN|nr:phenylalanine transporter [Klebsiella pneumoniae]